MENTNRPRDERMPGREGGDDMPSDPKRTREGDNDENQRGGSKPGQGGKDRQNPSTQTP
jgi:hypothetical protein